MADSYDHTTILATVRLLIADLCQLHDGGHPGSAMGMAALGVALWKYTMSYAPTHPEFVNRDRFVLSNGHACLFQYIFLHLSGYKSMTMDQLRSYGSSRIDKHCHGHPEIETEGIEVTTGLLGQGVANAVGLAMASKHLGRQFNREHLKLVTNRIWCVCGDACLQEGVATEAISLAGHLRLGNLTLIYDKNDITCDGHVSIATSDDIAMRMEACGWTVVQVRDGTHDVAAIVKALYKAKESQTKPTFVIVPTIIGVGSELAGTARAHSTAFGEVQVRTMKNAAGFDPNQSFVIPEPVKKFFGDLADRGRSVMEEWNSVLSAYKTKYPQSGTAFEAQMNGHLESGWRQYLTTMYPREEMSLRHSAGMVFRPLGANVSNFIVGSADVSDYGDLAWEGIEKFGSASDNSNSRAGPEDHNICPSRFVHYGCREHAMVAITNGMAAYQLGAIIPVTSSFLMFYTYAIAAIRLAALQELQIIHVGSHDSIGVGKDGPTHQPIEFGALFRAMPNLLYIRPGDTEEVIGAWTVAIESRKRPTIISASRHDVPQLWPMTNRDGVAKGAYVIKETAIPDVTIIGVGGELHMAVDVAVSLLADASKHARVVSFPCQRLFDSQPHEYRRSVLRRTTGAGRVPVIVIEPFVANGWERYANAGLCMSTSGFGKSLPAKDNYQVFGFETSTMVSKIVRYLTDIGGGVVDLEDFVELNERYA